jgi:hypothetical protein
MSEPMRRFVILIALLFSTAAPLASHAVEAQLAVVMAVHSERSTRVFVANSRLPEGKVKGGGFMAVKLVDGAWGDASLALVNVPERLLVAAYDIVELTPADISVLTKPGSGVATRVSPTSTLSP